MLARCCSSSSSSARCSGAVSISISRSLLHGCRPTAKPFTANPINHQSLHRPLRLQVVNKSGGGKKSGGSQSRQKKKPTGKKPVVPPSYLELLFRTNPLLSRLQDGTLLLGDIVMLLATEASSERIPLDSMLPLTGVMVVSWLGAAVYLGDYRGITPTSDDWTLSMLGPSFFGVINSTLTWGISMVISIAVYSLMVANNLLDASPIVDGLGTDDLSPQLEVVVALLIIMSCWRGIAWKLRGDRMGY